MTTKTIPIFLALLMAVFTGCTALDSEPSAEVTKSANPVRVAPPGAPEDTCWDRHISPAIIETVTEQIMVQPPETNAEGAVIHPAVFRTETRQDIVQPRSESWVEILCSDAVTPEFIASVQRALAARGLYRGGITGKIDRQTRLAIRRYQQAQQGLNSSVLSLESARSLGLAAIPQAAS